MLTVFADLTPESAVFLGLVSVGAIWFVLAFAGADAAYFDPRPLLARTVRSEAVYPLLREFDNARHASCEALRDAAALLILLTTSPERAA
jgi:hypothetical protein